MFDLGKGVTEQWERGEELLGRAVCTRPGKQKRKKKNLFLIVCEKGVLGFK